MTKELNLIKTNGKPRQRLSNPDLRAVSTSTRNFPNRLGNGADVYLSSAELAAVVASMGRLPTVAEYQERVAGIEPMSAEIYRYLNFNEMDEYKVSSN